jgi:hypothetical protein
MLGPNVPSEHRSVSCNQHATTLSRADPCNAQFRLIASLNTQCMYFSAALADVTLSAVCQSRPGATDQVGF